MSDPTTYKIAILLPGTTGSTLLGTIKGVETIIWPDLVETTVDSDEKAALNMLERTDLAPGTPVSSNSPTKGYGVFINYFENLPGQNKFTYINAQSGTAQDPNNVQVDLPTSLTSNLLIGFAYDWRLDNATSAKSLKNLLSDINTAYGNSYDLYLIGHSMGGIVSRAYLENPDYQNDPWYNPNNNQIQGLITLGTPHLGAPLAIKAIVGTMSPGNLAFETLIQGFMNNSFSYSSYELLPPPTSMAPNANSDHLNFINDSTNYNLFDTIDNSTLQKLGSYIYINKNLSVDDLTSAKKFLGSLDYDGTKFSNYPDYYCVYGITSTCLGFSYDKTNEDLDDMLFYLPPNPDFNNYGDSIVPYWSATFEGRNIPSNQTYPVDDVNHLNLPSDQGVQNQVATWMGVA